MVVPTSGSEYLEGFEGKGEGFLAERFEHVHYVLFSKKGFTSAMRAEANEYDIRLVEPQEMVQ